MRRRTIIAGLSCAVAGWPLAPRAQEQARVAALWPFVDGGAEGRSLARAFRSALGEHGQTNLQVDDRWGGADVERTRALAAEIVKANPQVIFAFLNAQLSAVSALTKTIPIIFVGASDPVGSGYVASRQRPGGNITGFTLYEASLAGKWLAALKEAAPTLRHVTLLSNANTEVRRGNFYTEALGTTGTALGLETAVVMVSAADAIDPVIAALGQRGDAGLIVAPGTFSEANGDRIVALTAEHRVPTVFAIRRFAHRGGLMSYGPDPADAVRRAASYVDRILHGEKPAALPVQAPTKFDFIVNLKTAQALGLTISSALLAQADEIVE
ncbi:ABC transporter substrate-binding protein [Methylobacterium sp. E-066]|uniref:ABC transporter substrate-binding protein n=1 Tax=Methylobacterium sp. E-066 TaxID=2836584 RepID=UPI001FBB33CA|nr:ABC transporter substrate-binding protein [Methylobacterium sp. E-066]MCJ2143220.1 ABC transporter substrate-binding protein [Methylobacterium sp. E-066]